MLLGFGLLFGYAFVVWLVFFRFKWMKFNIPWALASIFVGVHILLVFMLGLRYVTPTSTEAKMIQHTIQLTPRLTQPTLVKAVLVEPNADVKKGQPLFLFDRTTYEANVRKLEAQLAHATQNVKILKTDQDINEQKVQKNRSSLEYAKYQFNLAQDLASKGAGPVEDVQKWQSEVRQLEAAIKEAQGETERATLQYNSKIGGVNTSVAEIQAELDLARYYLENTTMVAPEDGRVINLQVRPGMVAGDYRVGAIATFVVDADRYLLANYFQENLKYVKSGQTVEVALDLYPGQIFQGKVEAIWPGSGTGQMLPSGVLPSFHFTPTEAPQGQFVVAIKLTDKNQAQFPIGTEGRAAIYTNPESSFVALRKIMLRAYTWFNFLYPFS